MKTFFPLVNIPKAQQKGSQLPTYTTGTRMERPVYESEIAVTRAIATGTFTGNSATAYRLAKAWEKQCAEDNRPKFFPKKKAKVHNDCINHTLSFSH